MTPRTKPCRTTWLASGFLVRTRRYTERERARGPKVCGRYYTLCLPRFPGFGVVFSVVLAGCAVWTLGKDPIGRGLEVEGERVAVAIHAYYARNAEYPRSLVNLVPDFLPEVPDARLHFDPARNQIGFAYSPFLGAGRAVCNTTIDVIAWHCKGVL